MKDKFVSIDSIEYDNNSFLYNLVRYNLVVKDMDSFNYFSDVNTLINAFLTDDFMYSKLIDFISTNNYSNIKVLYYDKDNILSTDAISVVDIVNYCQNNCLKMNERIKYLNHIVSFEYLKETLESTKIKVNNKTYDAVYLLDLLVSDDTRFDNMSEEEGRALCSFVKSKNLFKLVIINEEYINRFKELDNIINTSYEDNFSSIIDDIIIDSKLDQKLNDCNILTLSNLDKVLYIYFQMCNYLNYKKDEIISFDNLDNVTLYSSVNETEFAFIYAYYLRSFGIDFNINFNSSEIITFEYGEYELAISKKDISKSMSNVKNGLPVVGLNCVSLSEIIRNKFYEHFYKILLDSEMKKIDEIEFRKNVSVYENNINSVEMPIKIYAFLKNVMRHKVLNESNEEYINKLYNVLFKNDENIKLYIDVTDRLNLIFTIDDYCYVINETNLNNIKRIDLSELNKYVEENGLSDNYVRGIKK